MADRLHEAREDLTDFSLNMHRAIQSLMEELEAVDWYEQRLTAATDEDLKAILTHNRDEEKEHAAMLIEWLRRQDDAFDEQLKEYLFSDDPITEVEAKASDS